MTRQEDWMLMHRVAAGDEAAVAELYDRFSSLVYKVAMQLLAVKLGERTTGPSGEAWTKIVQWLRD